MNRRSLVGIIAGATLLGAAALTVPKFYPEQISYGEYTYSPIAHKII
jgi:hypothetical protein